MCRTVAGGLEALVRNSAIRSCVLCLVFVAGLTVLTSGARAQWGNWGRFFQPPVDSEQIELLEELIGADEGQREAIGAMFEGFQSRHQQSVEAMREIFQKAREEAQRSRDQSVWMDVQKRAIEFSKHTTSMRDAFFEDLQLLLSPEQMEQWPAFERAHRRATLLDTGQVFISGSTLDLVRLADDAGDEVTDVEGVGDLVQRYEVQLDRILVESDEMGREHLEKTQEMLEAGGNFFTNMNEYGQMFDEARAVQVRIRDLNDRFARQIIARLPEENRSEIEAEFNRQFMPAVYGRTFVDNAFDVALGLGDLSDDQRSASTPCASSTSGRPRRSGPSGPTP